ncbi:phospholipid-transporting ATPase ABCA3-like [Oppia nitens]|uniref:phospholipid-transporting ATPase ABCA3-like n=1 Tax=Oppia nitens TaxID=1686743 RepID=UPI0023DAAF4E|nr:phospholipid-transporting ATPase ABCA3-like [Oppia nitens]
MQLGIELTNIVEEEDDIDIDNKLPKHLDYKITLQSEDYRTNYNHYLVINDYKNFPPKYHSGYYGRLDFAQIQLIIDLAFISLVTNGSVDLITQQQQNVEFFTQRMPLPSMTVLEKFENSYYLSVYGNNHIVTAILLFNMTIMLSVIIKRTVEERQTRITDYLLQLGVRRHELWLSVILDGLIVISLVDYSGDITIGGHDISREQHLVQNMTGICPQDNVYFKFLTISDHLTIFSRLKQLIRNNNDGYTDKQLIQLLDLNKDVNKEAYQLSGGTLRRLVLAIAFIGPNDVLILDEPSAALDPKVTRKVWDLIRDSRKNKTILITTHHLDEANLLADQISIIAKGMVCFNGSTLDMKKQFNSGYQLKICKSIEYETDNQITEIIRKYTNIKKISKKCLIDTQQEVNYELNFEDNHRFYEMFSELEENKSNLAINDISLDMQTLEGSYAKIISENNFQNNLNENYFETEITDEDNNFILENNTIVSNNNNNKLISQQLKPLVYQLYAIFIKRLLYLSMNITQLITLVIIPILTIILLFISLKIVYNLSIYDKEPICLNSNQLYGKNKLGFIDSNNNTNFENAYTSVLDDNNLDKLIISNHKSDDENIQDFLLEYSTIGYINYFKNLLYGVSVNFDTNNNNNNILKNITVWSNHLAIHSLPISISVTSDPLKINWSGNELNKYYKRVFNFDVLIGVNYLTFMCLFTFMSSTYVLLPITERKTQFKLLQLMSGLKPITYWSLNLLFDLILHSLLSLVYVFVYYMFDTDMIFIGPENHFTAIYLTFVFYGFSFIPFAYLISFIFSKPSSGFTFISLYNIIIGSLIELIQMNLSYRPSWKLLSKNLNEEIKEIPLEDLTLETTPDLRQEYEMVSKIIRNNDLNNVSLVVENLNKMLNKTTIIPKSLSFVVNNGECFGLLGINGSGKTTTFRLLTGDLELDSGNAYLGSAEANLLTNRRQFFSQIGYCPQNDALLDRLTGRQTIIFFGRLRGLSKASLIRFIDNICQKFSLQTIIDKRLSTYSGGNRRKLSLAIALIGSPRLLLLDEPTNGVDPDSRLNIWQILRQLISESNISILLSSHNMEECETLCSRLAILSNGVIKTIGSLPQLRKSFANGFDIILKLNCDSKSYDHINDELDSKMKQLFGEKSIINNKYSNSGVFYYHLIGDDLKLSQIFQSMQSVKQDFNLEDYMCGNSGLQQAFLAITTFNT